MKYSSSNSYLDSMKRPNKIKEESHKNTIIKVCPINNGIFWFWAAKPLFIFYSNYSEASTGGVL